MIARLLHAFENEARRASTLNEDQTAQIDRVLTILVNGVMDDLTAAQDLLDRWGRIPESYQYRNFHLVPTLMGQGLANLLDRSPGPAASRIQSARRSFPKDDLFFREYIFAKCWEQGLHRRYGALLLGEEGAPLLDRLREAFGESGPSPMASFGERPGRLDVAEGTTGTAAWSRPGCRAFRRQNCYTVIALLGSKHTPFESPFERRLLVPPK